MSRRRLWTPPRSSHAAAALWAMVRRGAGAPPPRRLSARGTLPSAPRFKPPARRRRTEAREWPSRRMWGCGRGWGWGGWGAGWRLGGRRHRRPPTRPPSSADRGSSRPSSRSLAVALGAPEDGDHFLSLARDAQQLPAALAHVGAPADELLPFLGRGPEDAQVGDRLPVRRVRFGRHGERRR